MHQRINVTLPEETIRMLDRLTKKRIAAASLIPPSDAT